MSRHEARIGYGAELPLEFNGRSGQPSTGFYNFEKTGFLAAISIGLARLRRTAQEIFGGQRQDRDFGLGLRGFMTVQDSRC